MSGAGHLVEGGKGHERLGGLGPPRCITGAKGPPGVLQEARLQLGVTERRLRHFLKEVL